jgi:hypothetical protein
MNPQDIAAELERGLSADVWLGRDYWQDYVRLGYADPAEAEQSIADLDRLHAAMQDAVRVLRERAFTVNGEE